MDDAERLRDSSKAGDVDAVKKVLAAALASGGAAAVANMLRAGDRQVAASQPHRTLRRVSLRRTDLSALDPQGYAAIHIASMRGHKEVSILL